MNRELRQALKLYGPLAVLVIAAFVVAYQFIQPAPPERIRIASGGPDGAYYRFARQYAEHLAREGIEAEVVRTAGSVENIRLLRAGEVDVALVQGGIPAETPGLALYSLGSLYYEPLWWFARAGQTPRDLRDLRGRRVAVGAAGSGTRALVLRLLAETGIDAGNTQLLPLGGAEAAAALRRGEVDAAFLVTAPSSPLVQALLRDPDVQLVSFRRAEALARRHRFLTGVPLPEGVADLRENLPPRDVRLLAPAANLVVSEGTHPAISDLLLQIIDAVHGEGDWFAAYGEFPRPDLLAFPLADEARRYYEHGPPFLQRYLPFWAASLIDRLKVMLLPLILMLLPLLKAIPPLVDWRMASRIYRWYDDLARVDDALTGADARRREVALEELRRIEDEVRQIEVPLSYARRLYHLRQHIDLVRRRAAEAPCGD